MILCSIVGLLVIREMRNWRDGRRFCEFFAGFVKYIGNSASDIDKANGADLPDIDDLLRDHYEFYYIVEKLVMTE